MKIISKLTLGSTGKNYNSRKGIIENEFGSISLETALVLPLFLIFLSYIYIFNSSIRIDLLYQETAYSAVKDLEISLSVQDINELETANLLDIKSILFELLSKKLNEFWAYHRHEYWLKEHLNQETKDFFLRNRQGCLDIDEDKNIKYYFSYTTPKILGGKTYSYSLPVPYWGGSDINVFERVFEKSSEKREDNIWNENQFTRGKQFRKRYGANLPSNYPVIAAYNSGTVKSIKSIDLTAPSYQTEMSIKHRINNLANKLANFTGTDNWGREKISIKSQDIRNRVLLIIVPENSPDYSVNVIKNLKLEWQRKNIKIELIMYGNSKKYE